MSIECWSCRSRSARASQRELHDELGQTLTALKMDVIGLMEKTTGTPVHGRHRQRVLTTLDATVSSVQRIYAELRPASSTISA